MITHIKKKCNSTIVDIDKIRPSRRLPFTLSIFVFINERPTEPQNGPMGLL